MFELGLLGISAHVVDSLAHPGGQCAELYPDKPIYDIPALPVCGAQELVDRLLQQIKPFNPQLHLGHEVVEFARREDGRFHLATAGGVSFDAGTVVIAAGVGSFQPRRIGIEGADAFEGGAIQYRVKSAARLAGKHLVIFGGGDSALDWTLELLPRAAAMTLVHRRREFRAAPASVARMQRARQRRAACAASRRCRTRCMVENGALRGVNIKLPDGAVHALPADQLLVFFGLHPKLGPIAEWGLALEKKALKVDTEKFQTSLPGVFAVGDINTYPGKKKLILSGFHEAALAAFAIQHHLYPQKKQFLQYTTTSPIMHQRLGRAGLIARQLGAQLMDQRARGSAAAARAGAARGQPVPRREPRHRQPAGVRRPGAGPGAVRPLPRRWRGAWCTRCTPTSCAAATATRRSSTRWTAASTATASPTAASSPSSTAQQIFNMTASFQVAESGFDHQIACRRCRRRRACRSRAGRRRRCWRACRSGCGASSSSRGPSSSAPVQPIDYLRPRRAAPAREVWFRAVGTLPDDEMLHRRLLAYVSDFFLLDTATLPHGTSLLTVEHRHGEHRSRHVVPPPAARG